MTRVNWRPSNLLNPVPAVMVSCADEEGNANVMTAAWTGTICSDPVMVSVSIRKNRYSHDIIQRTGEFVINLTTDELVRAADFCGVRSGRDIDKFEACKLTPIPSKEVAVPAIAESPVAIECRVEKCIPLGSHDMFLAKVLAVSIDDSYMDEKSKFHLNKTGIVAYSHGEYFELGKRDGSFGYSVRKKRTKKKEKKK